MVSLLPSHWDEQLDPRLQERLPRLAARDGKELATALWSPPVEAKREFIQIVIEMLLADRALMGSHHPPFEVRDGQMNAWQ